MLDKVLENVFIGATQSIKLLELDVKGAETKAMLDADDLVKNKKIAYISVELYKVTLAHVVRDRRLQLYQARPSLSAQ